MKQGIVLNPLIKLFISAEARVSMASGNELLGILEVDLSALTLPVGTKWAPNIWAYSMTDTKCVIKHGYKCVQVPSSLTLVPVQSQPLEIADHGLLRLAR